MKGDAIGASGSVITPCNKIDKPQFVTDFVTLRNDVHYKCIITTQIRFLINFGVM